MLVKFKVYFSKYILVKSIKVKNLVIFWCYSPNGVVKFTFDHFIWLKRANNYVYFFFKEHKNNFIQVRLFKNLILGLLRKYRIELWFKGVGFKLLINKVKNEFYFSLGFSHILKFKLPTSCNIELVGKRKLFLSGLCLQKLTQLTSYLQSKKLPDVYLSKGINFKYKVVDTKPGKVQNN